MRSSVRRFGVFILFATFILAPAYLRAQDENNITVVGSGIVQPLLQTLIDASEVEASFSMDVTGTTTGFATFCAGEADVTTATRPISSDERTLCGDNGIAPLELMIGHNILAFIGSPADTTLEVCLIGDELNTIFAPSVEGAVTNWNQVLSEGPDLALTTYVPDDVTPEYTILDALIEGDGIRSDATAGSAAEIIETIGSTNGAIGVVTLTQALGAAEAVRIFELDAAAVQGCQQPTAAAVEDSLYPAAESLYLYVNASGLTDAGLTDLLNFVVSADAAAAVTEAGFTPPTDIASQTNQADLQAALSGELPVQTGGGFEISPGMTGQAGIGGSGEGFRFLKPAVDAFSAIVPGVTVNLNLDGLPAGFRRLCNGEVDLVYAHRPMTAEEAANCAANNITTSTIALGTPAVVLVANGNTDYLGCLTTDQITTLWSAGSTDEISAWNQVNAEFPDTAMTLFAPQPGSNTMDLMLLAASNSTLAGRVDVELDDDPLYRAAATANVDGALTFMDWYEYQDVLENNQANIQLVAVDAGSGCVMPDVSTIRSQEYPLTRQGWLIVNQNQLARPDLQTLLWFMFGDDQFSNFENAGYVGVRLNDLAAVRSTLLAGFAEAQAAAAEATPEATAEATAETTAEATPETE